LSPWRRSVTNAVINIASHLLLFAHAMSLSTREIEVDYSPWLGEDYKQKRPDVKRVSTLIMNHTTLFDIPALQTQGSPSFATKEGVKKVPVAGFLVKVSQGIFLNRGGSEAEREAAIN